MNKKYMLFNQNEQEQKPLSVIWKDFWSQGEEQKKYEKRRDQISSTLNMQSDISCQNGLI